MADNDFSNLSEKINNVVQKAVDTMDFTSLNDDISKSVNNALTEVKKSLQLDNLITSGDKINLNKNNYKNYEKDNSLNLGNNVDVASQSNNYINNNIQFNNKQQNSGYSNNIQQQYKSQGYSNAQQQYKSQGYSNVQQQYKNSSNNKGIHYFNTLPKVEDINKTINNVAKDIKDKGTHYFNTLPKANEIPNVINKTLNNSARKTRIPAVYSGNITSVLNMTFGILGLLGFGIAFIVIGIVALMTGMEMGYIIALVLTGIFSAISIFCLRQGVVVRKRLKRFRVYVRKLQDNKGFCSIKELANQIGKDEYFVIRDVQKILSFGMLPEGHIDEQKTCLIGTRESYEQYKLAQNSLKERQVEEKILEKQMKEMEKALEEISPELKESVKEGKAYIKKIRSANEEIKGEEISKKLTRLEIITDRIFAHIEKHPEQIPEIRKFMEYYLPTTLKLVETYKECDNQPIQGKNILTAKKEIENTLDTINSAFETLLNGLFKSTSMDISTDISVLQTMLAQEGLIEGEFTFKEREDNYYE